jgi:hypothetical protein
MMSQYPPSSFDPNQVEFAERPPAWPLVIGWVSIAWTAVGLLCSVCGVGAVAVMPQFMPPEQGPLPPTMQLTPLMVGLTGAGVLMAFFLLTCGVMCLRRNPACRSLYLIYAFLGLAMVGATIYLQLQQSATMAKWAAENPNSVYAQGYKTPGQIQASQAIGVVMGILFGGAWPTFLLIWFGLVKTKPEQFGKAAAIVA